MKFWLCKFHQRYGEMEHYMYGIYSSKDLENMNYKSEDDELKLLSEFFGEPFTMKDEEGGSYWTKDGMSLVRFDGMINIKKSELKTLEKVGVYW